jgi:hypothetical protein
MFNWFYKLKNGIKNLIFWIPVIWNDEDFDYYHTYKILYNKLNKMEQFYRSDKAWSADALQTADEIKVAKYLTKRLMKDEYLTNALMWHEQKYSDFLDKALHFEPDKDNPKLSTWKDLNTEDEQKSFDRCCKHSDFMEKQDREYLFSYLCKNIKNWWD